MRKIVEKIRAQLAGEWIPLLYQEKIRSQRSRSFHLELAPKENDPEILHTLLGIELKLGNRRTAVPDLATARYIRVFARIGCADFAIPYDISKISMIADELETAWYRMLLVLDQEVCGLPIPSGRRLRSALIREMRIEVGRIGPGDMMPAFDRETKQNKS